MSTVLSVAGNIPLVEPLAVSSTFARSTTTDIAALTTIANAIAIPSFIGGGGTIGSRTDLTDDQKEQAIRDWVWRNFYFSGSNQATTPALNNLYRSLEIYQWRFGGTGPSGTAYSAGNPALNGGKGPTVGCSQINYVHMGLLAGIGIPTRAVSASSATQGGDTETEFWSPTYGKWVLVLAPMNAHKTFPDGTPVSFLEHVMVERNHGLPAAVSGAGIFTGVGLSGSNGYDFQGSVTEGPYWQTFSVTALWERGSEYHFRSGTGPSFLSIPPRLAGNQQIVMAQSLADIAFTVNGLRATLDQALQGGMLMAYLEHNMLELSSLQVLPPGGAWTNIATTVAPSTQNAQAIYGFYPVAGATWKFRAVGALGNTSNIVTVTA